VEFHVLIGTRCVGYLRPETLREKMFEVTLDFRKWEKVFVLASPESLVNPS
jgi:hypothetical protein